MNDSLTDAERLALLGDAQQRLMGAIMDYLRAGKDVDSIVEIARDMAEFSQRFKRHTVAESEEQV